MTRAQRFFRWIPVTVCVAAGVMFVCLVALLVAGQPALERYYENRSLLKNGVLWPVSLAFCGAWFWMRKREKPAGKDRVWPVRILFLVVLVMQFLVARTCWGDLGWDPGTVRATAEALARGEPLPQPDYFIGVPNNAPITMLVLVPIWVAVKLGLAVPWVVMPYICAVLLNLSAYLCWECVRACTQSRTARSFALVVSICWIALSPYIVYPYTDTMSILFPVLSLYLYLRMKKPVLKWLLISFLCFFGTAVKPTVLIFFIALSILGVCGFIAQRPVGKAVWKRAAAICLVVILGAIPGTVFQQKSVEFLTDGKQENTQLSMTHYLMLGMNDETMGGHSIPDVEYTMGFATLREAQMANLRRAWERVAARGVMGNLEFFSIKAFKAYADGSFASHSSFLEVSIPKRTDTLSVFLRQLYNRKGAWMPYCQTIVQALWLGILMLCAVAGLRGRKRPEIALLCLTFIGLTAYLLLFEVWPRYLFLFAPFFVILSAMAFDKPLLFKRRV